MENFIITEMDQADKFINQTISSWMAIVAVVLVIIVALMIVMIVAQWILFKKAGKNGWEAIVPFYNTYVLVEISGLNWWYFLIAISGSILSLIGLNQLAPIALLAQLAVNFFIFYNLAKKTHQNEILFGILGILVPFVPAMIIGFSKKINFDNSVTVSPNGPID